MLASDYWGEVIVAVAEGAASDWEERARSAAECLARYKRPRAYVSVEALPRNPQGKVRRVDVRALVLSDWELQDGPHPKLVRRAP